MLKAIKQVKPKRTIYNHTTPINQDFRRRNLYTTMLVKFPIALLAVSSGAMAYKNK